MEVNGEPQGVVTLPREGEPIGPKIFVDVYLAPHGKAEDAKGLEERLKNADIYAPEAWGWSSDQLAITRAVSDGKVKPEMAIQTLFSNIEFKAHHLEAFKTLYGSGKPVIFVDEPSSPEATSGYRLLFQEPYIERSWGFDRVLNEIKNWVKSRNEMMRRREYHIASQIQPEVDKILEERPDLRQKDELRILLTLGYEHPLVGHDLKTLGLAYKREYSRKPQEFSYVSQAEYRHALGKEIDDTLAARIYMERIFQILESNFYDFIRDEYKLLRFRRHALSQLGTRDAKDIFINIRKGERNIYALQDKLREKGITLPDSEEEMDASLSRKK